MQETQVWFLAGELRSHLPQGNKTQALQPLSLHSGAQVPQLESPSATTTAHTHRNHKQRVCEPQGKSCVLQRGPDTAKQIIKLFFFKGKIRSQLEGAGWDQCSQILIPGRGQRRHVQDQSQVGRWTGSTGNSQHWIHTVDKQSILQFHWMGFVSL